MTKGTLQALRATGPASLNRSNGAAITVLLTLTLAAVAGCGGPTNEASQTKSPSPGEAPGAAGTAASSPPGGASPGAAPHGGLPAPGRIDHSDATAVSKAAVTTMWSVDTAVDTAQRDAYRRARPFLTPQYFATIAGEKSGKLSNAWLQHRAYASVRLAPQQIDSGAGSDTSTAARRQWTITVTPTGRDGWRGGKVEAVAFVSLTRDAASAPWRVSAVTTG